VTGKDVMAIIDTLLTMATWERVSNGRNAWVTRWVPIRLTAKWASSSEGR